MADPAEPPNAVLIGDGANGNGNGVLISKAHRDGVFSVVLFVAIIGIVGLGIASFMRYPLYEVGVTSCFYVLSNVVSYLLGMKSSTTVPPAVSIKSTP